MTHRQASPIQIFMAPAEGNIPSAAAPALKVGPGDLQSADSRPTSGFPADAEQGPKTAPGPLDPPQGPSSASACSQGSSAVSLNEPGTPQRSMAAPKNLRALPPRQESVSPVEAERTQDSPGMNRNQASPCDEMINAAHPPLGAQTHMPNWEPIASPSHPPTARDVSQGGAQAQAASATKPSSAAVAKPAPEDPGAQLDDASDLSLPELSAVHEGSKVAHHGEFEIKWSPSPGDINQAMDEARTLQQVFEQSAEEEIESHHHHGAKGAMIDHLCESIKAPSALSRERDTTEESCEHL